MMHFRAQLLIATGLVLRHKQTNLNTHRITIERSTNQMTGGIEGDCLVNADWPTADSIEIIL